MTVSIENTPSFHLAFSFFKAPRGALYFKVKCKLCFSRALKQVKSVTSAFFLPTCYHHDNILKHALIL